MFSNNSLAKIILDACGYVSRARKVYSLHHRQRLFKTYGENNITISGTGSTCARWSHENLKTIPTLNKGSVGILSYCYVLKMK